MKYNSDEFTYGVELEYADVLFGQPLPDDCSWNTKDNTVVNSNGIANDPKGEIWPYGGEINVRPESSVDAEVAVIGEINRMLEPKPTINYRCNLHIHIRVPGLNQDLEYCKKLLDYITKYGQEAFDIVEKIPRPDPSQMTKEEYDGAMKRFKRRKKSHQYMLPQNRLDEMMAAKTVHEFFEGHAPIGTNGVRMWYFSPRAGINLRQMWEETNTIEFRHFPGTINLEEMRSCIQWCKEFLIHALSDEQLSPKEFYEPANFTFPKFATYDHKLETMYKWTNFEDNSRAVVRERIEQLKVEGYI